MKKITLLLALFVAVIAIGQNSRSGNAIVINEIDADQTSTDTEEFIELFSENPNTSLNGLVLVLFNGSSDTSYNAVDLNGFSTDGNGFFIIGTDAIPGVDISLGADNTVQNGADAVALYIDDIANWPNGTAATTTNLLDAVVYGTSDADDTGLLTALGETIQFDENLNGMKDTESIQRQDVSSDLFCTTTPTLRATNACPSCTFAITDTTITCDSETGGVDSVTIEIDYIGGGNEAYTVQITSGGGTVGGDDPTTTAAGTITLTSVSEDTMIELTISSSQCNIVENITTPECLPATDVADIATLRGSAQGLSYTLTGEAILTYQQNFRNQKFIEDATGAILIDDDNDVITSTYAIGDAVHSNGTAYIAIAASTNQTPPNGTYWQIVAEANYPTQTGNADKALTTDGSAASWGSIHADHVDFTNSGTGGVERTLQAKLEDVVNVKDFGAVGDGVTDDTAAINAASTFAVDNNKILVCDGIAALKGDWVIPDGLVFEAKGLTITRVSTQPSINNNVNIKGVTWDAQGSQTSLLVTGYNNWVLSDCHFNNAAKFGLEGGAGSPVEDFKLIRCSASNNGSSLPKADINLSPI